MIHIFYVIAFLGFTWQVTAQSEATLDKIVMVNGEIKTGQIVGINDVQVEFVHANETLKYTLEKAKISKIEFGSSGRIEVYNDVKPESSAAPNLADHHNKIAVLPFAYVRDGRQQRNDVTETTTQKEFYNLMRGHMGQLKIQDPQNTVALLRKNGVTDETFEHYMMPEIANMLGVEYVVRGILTINQQGSTSYSSNYSSYTAKKSNPGTNKWSFGSTNSTLQFNTTVDIALYNDAGEVIFSRSKESFWPTDDAYQMTFPFLLKRMPVYTK